LTNNASFSATGLSAVQASASTTIGSPAGGSPSLSLSKAVSKTCSRPETAPPTR
jgi:hypothetical protein